MRTKLEFSNIFKALIQVSIYTSVVLSPAALKASDLQIYSGGTSGGTKTFVMMLDNSGSMGAIDLPSGVSCITRSTNVSFNGRQFVTENLVSDAGTSYSLNYCADANGTRYYDRMSNLKRAMFDLMATETIDSDKSLTGTINLAEVVMGVGAYPQGSGGAILVPASVLGEPGSTQRLAIERVIAGLSPTFRTPTAFAYSTAVAHLMGTSTTTTTNLITQSYRKLSGGWERCDSWTTNAFSANCQRWVSISNTPSDINNFYNFSKYPVGVVGDGYYRKVETGQPWKIQEKYYLSSGTWRQCTKWYEINANGLRQCSEWNTVLPSMPSDANDYFLNSSYGDYYGAGTNNTLVTRLGEDGEGTYVRYQVPQLSSPLPAVSDRKSCDGQGVYMLSDGEPNDGPEPAVMLSMQNVLGRFGNDFRCPTNGLINTTYNSESSPNSGWHCVGELARRINNPNLNPQNVRFKTAFVGYGAGFASLTNNDQINACRLGSTESGDSCSPDASNALLRNDSTGYGLGGYTYAQSSQDVLDSIVKFIDGLNGDAVSSLTTGAWAVPIDTLNPNGLQPHAYMRVLQPEPGSNKVSWIGNLKKYHLVDGVLRASETTTSGAILDTNGRFAGPSDQWSDTVNDGGVVTSGGAYSKVPLPYGQSDQGFDTRLRRVYTDLTTNDSNNIIKMDNDSNLASATMLKVVERDEASITNPSYVLNKFKEQDKLKYASNRVKRSLLNYLGYSVDINETDLPETLDAPAESQNAMSGIIHSLPLQLTYEGDLDSDGLLSTTRKQYTLFGTMEGGLRLVDASSGAEQMTFVPSEILLDNASQIALKPQQSNSSGLAHGVDAPWVADASYKAESTTTTSAAGSKKTTAMKAAKMNVYGGLRMGGESYYGLDLLSPTQPKFLFRIGRDQADFSRMGQSWSKPVVANVRYQGKVRRVVIIGGGYDECYEDPRFILKSSGDSTSCGTKTIAQGNAIYIIDALTGERLWWASNKDSNSNHPDLKHSVVSGISAVDGNNDGLVDHLYFGDLGGQVFRIDLNNAITGNTNVNLFATRIVKIIDLATKADGTSITNGDNPRFYEAPTVTIHRDNSQKFILVSLVGGDRSSPLDVAPTSRIGLPSLLTGRPVNNVYGIMDIDAVKTDIMNATTALESRNLKLSHLINNPGVGYTSAASLMNAYAPYNPKPEGSEDNRKFGWYRSLSTTYEGKEVANGTFRKPGGIKAFEAPIAITGNLIVSVYDPESKELGFNTNACEPSIIGETYRQYYCLPFGVCMTKTSEGYSFNTQQEKLTGYQNPKDTSILDSIRKPIGPGIQGNVLAPKTQSGEQTECGSLQLAGINSGTGEWTCKVKQQPLNWYSSSIRAN